MLEQWPPWVANSKPSLELEEQWLVEEEWWVRWWDGEMVGATNGEREIGN